MRSRRVLHTVESHTEGMATRVVTGGVPALPGTTMAERRLWFLEDNDELRTMLMCEPRGHAAMSGAILQPPTRPDADWGVLFIEVSGCLPMCGHGTIGVATVLVETGMVPVTEPVTPVRLDTPAGLVTAEVHVADGEAISVTIANVDSFTSQLDAHVDVPGLGRVVYDMAFGGNFYAMVESADLGLAVDREHKQQLMDAGLAIMAAINDHDPPAHPDDPRITGCRHVQLIAAGSTARHSKNAMVIYPGWFDRSPCGTGTSARMAQLYSRGELALHTEFVNESLIGTQFTGQLIDTASLTDGTTAVVPTINGRAWLTGTAQYFLDPADPFPAGLWL